MDLTQIDTKEAAEVGAVLELRAPDGSALLQEDKTPVTITLLGKDSETYRKARNATSNRYLAAGARMKITAEAGEADAISLLAKCTKAWNGIGIGEPSTPCTYENAVRLFEMFPFIREQADAFIDDRANFSKASPKS